MSGGEPDREDGLEAYRAKRDAAQTPEPFGEDAPAIPPGVFVVQKHAARRLHYDLRLEIDGRLRSWAVPRGFSFDPEEKRLAVKVEDHPLDYVDFEAVIPDGYGAGSMIVWDRGLWRPLDPVKEGLQKGKLLFRLEGYKLRGVWTLFSTARKGETSNEWLLMKKPDRFADPERNVPETSILSGLAVEELADPDPRRQAALARVAAAPEGRLRLARLDPMLAETRPEPFDDPGWLFELKYDGFRLLAAREGGHSRLRYRSGRDATRAFPELVASLNALPYERLVLDGEVVVLDPMGKPVFNRLQKRVQLERQRDLERARWTHPVTYMVFDVLELEGRDLRLLPLVERKAILKTLLPEAGPLRFTDHIEGRGEALFDLVEAQGLEGVVAKRAASPYRETRSADWLKIRSETTEAFAVIGYTAPKGGRTGFGGLHLARPGPDGSWAYAGRVGSGFSGAQLDALADRLARSTVDTPVAEVPKADKSSVWVRPEIVVDVTFLTTSEEGIIRQSRLRAVREEPADELVRQGDLPPIEGPETSATGGAGFTLSNPAKIFFPEDGITKADLLEYHRAIAPWMLPYLEERPIALSRHPDGIHGKAFFQKHAPPFTPSWVRTARVWSEVNQAEREQFIVSGFDTLAYLVNLGCLPIHAWTARLGSLERPDWLVLDLDPKEAPFAHVARLARSARELAESVGLVPVVKTSGASGLHVLIPMGARYDHAQVRTLALVLAKILVARHPELATIDRSVDRRAGRVYVDYVQNGRGRLLAAAYTVRARPGAPVSVPLDWDEVTDDLDPGAFTVRTVPDRMRRRARCPLERALGPGPELAGVLERIAAVT